jgi:predicted RNase H-like HicB family nuclease
MTARNRKLDEKMDALPHGDVDSVDMTTELGTQGESLFTGLAATQKLIHNHKEEHAFYIEYTRTHRVKQWRDIPDSPIKLTTFSMEDYLKAALACAEYERDEDGVIVASVPGAVGFYSQGDSHEEARTNLMDAIEGNVLIALQMGWEIPNFPGVDIRTAVVSSDSA